MVDEQKKSAYMLFYNIINFILRYDIAISPINMLQTCHVIM